MGRCVPCLTGPSTSGLLWTSFPPPASGRRRENVVVAAFRQRQSERRRDRDRLDRGGGPRAACFGRVHRSRPEARSSAAYRSARDEGRRSAARSGSASRVRRERPRSPRRGRTRGHRVAHRVTAGACDAERWRVTHGIGGGARRASHQDPCVHDELSAVPSGTPEPEAGRLRVVAGVVRCGDEQARRDGGRGRDCLVGVRGRVRGRGEDRRPPRTRRSGGGHRDHRAAARANADRLAAEAAVKPR